MEYDHDAIRRAYPTEVQKIADGKGIFDWDGNPFTVDQSKVDAARIEIDKDNIGKFKPLIKLYDRADIINDIA